MTLQYVMLVNRVEVELIAPTEKGFIGKAFGREIRVIIDSGKCGRVIGRHKGNGRVFSSKAVLG